MSGRRGILLGPQGPASKLPTNACGIVRRFDIPKGLQGMLAARSPGQPGLGIESKLSSTPSKPEGTDQAAMPVKSGIEQIDRGNLGPLKPSVRAVREIPEQDDSDPVCAFFLLSGSAFLFTRGWFGVSEDRNFNFATAAFLFACGSLSFVSMRAAQSLLFNGLLVSSGLLACVFVAAILGAIDLPSGDQLASPTPG